MRLLLCLLLLSACSLVRVAKKKDVDASAWTAMSRVGLYVRDADQFHVRTNELYQSVSYSPGQTDEDKEALRALRPRLDQMNVSHQNILRAYDELNALKAKMDAVFDGRSKLSSDDARWEELQNLFELFEEQTELIGKDAEKYKAQSDEFMKIVKARGYQEGLDGQSFLAAIDHLGQQLQQNLDALAQQEMTLAPAAKAGAQELKKELVLDQQKLPAMKAKVQALVEKNPIVLKMDPRYPELMAVRGELEALVNARQASLQSFNQSVQKKP